MLLTLIAVLTGCGERSSGPDIQIRPAEPRKVTIQVTAPPRPTADTNLAGQFSGIGGKTSDLFQLAKGRYVLLLDVRGNDRFLAPDTWKIELFRIPDDVVLLDRSSRGVSGRSSGGFLIEDASWKLWFRLNVGDDAHWIVTLRRVGELPPTTPGPEATAQITKDPLKDPQPTPTSAPKPTPTKAPTGGSAPTPTRTPELPIPQKHIVEPGESLVKIAERYGPTVSVLIDLNSIQDPSLIRSGQVINIPPGSRTPVPTSTPTPLPTSTPQTYQSCKDVPESLIAVDTQGRRAVPRNLVPSAPDGDNDGFACGGQLELAPKPTSTQRIQALRNAVSLEFTLTMLPSIQTAAAHAEQRDWRRSGDYMELAAGSCDLARDAVAEIARLSAESVWNSVASHLGRACRGYWNAASVLHSGNIDAATRSLDNATTALQLATRLVPLF